MRRPEIDPNIKIELTYHGGDSLMEKSYEVIYQHVAQGSRQW